jgi:hypothetical protein
VQVCCALGFGNLGTRGGDDLIQKGRHNWWLNYTGMAQTARGARFDSTSFQLAIALGVGIMRKKEPALGCKESGSCTRPGQMPPGLPFLNGREVFEESVDILCENGAQGRGQGGDLRGYGMRIGEQGITE